jgi:hypothetical protein
MTDQEWARENVVKVLVIVNLGYVAHIVVCVGRHSSDLQTFVLQLTYALHHDILMTKFYI